MVSIATTTKAEHLLESLQKAIVEGDLQPGEKLREPDLARSFGTSRGPLRDALRRLEARRLVLSTPNAGARVTSLSAQQLAELYQVREALEGTTCRLAATHMSDNDIDQLDHLLSQHEQAIKEAGGRRYFRQEGDLDFHYRIADRCGNALLRSAICVDYYPLMRMYRHKFSVHEGRPTRALSEHRRIWSALAERDGELAEILMRRHIAAARKIIEDSLLNETDHD
ncbi:MAG: GntR family transcriptional regulator [Pseudomonadota bacterium]